MLARIMEFLKGNSAEKEPLQLIGFSPEVQALIRKHTDAELTLLEAKDYFEEGKVDETLPKGISFAHADKDSCRLISLLRQPLKEMGYFVFKSGWGRKIKICILKTADPMDALRVEGTNGVNYDLYPEELICVIRELDKKYNLKLELIGADFDWCQFSIVQAPKDWMAFSEEVYKICPDIVDQGTETVERLAQELEQTKELFFWWD